jgi:hypothetical protein
MYCFSVHIRDINLYISSKLGDDQVNGTRYPYLEEEKINASISCFREEKSSLASRSSAQMRAAANPMLAKVFGDRV